MMRRREFITLLGGAPIQVGEVGRIGHQTAHLDVLPSAMEREQPSIQRQSIDASSMRGLVAQGETGQRLTHLRDRNHSQYHGYDIC